MSLRGCAWGRVHERLLKFPGDLIEHVWDPPILALRLSCGGSVAKLNTLLGRLIMFTQNNRLFSRSQSPPYSRASRLVDDNWRLAFTGIVILYSQDPICPTIELSASSNTAIGKHAKRYEKYARSLISLNKSSFPELATSRRRSGRNARWLSKNKRSASWLYLFKLSEMDIEYSRLLQCTQYICAWTFDAASMRFKQSVPRFMVW